MVFTAAQRTAFFENNDQMGNPHATVVKLQEEGISRPDDLVDFDKNMIKQIADNLRRPAGRIPDPTPGAPAGATIPTPPFVFGAKSVMRLTAATKLVRYYEMVGHPLTPANMAWNTVMRNFNEQWKALEERKENENPDVPKITKALPVIKWTEAFTDYLSHAIGVRMIPLAYVIRPEADVPAAAPALAAGEPYSLEHGSVEQELVVRALHTHALFREDNSDAYYKLEVATRGTPYVHGLYQVIPEGKTRQGGMVGNHWAVCWEGQVGGGNQATRATPPHTCVEGTEQFFPGEVHRPTPQCVCLDAGLCRAHPVPAAKWAQLSWICAGRNSNQ